MSESRPLEVGFLLYPGMTLLDLVGPLQVLAFHSNVHLLWKTAEPVVSDTAGTAMLPTTTFGNCPSALDIFMVPGGFGTAAMLQDAEVIDFVRAAGASATYVTSVCTGSLILGAAGLLDGYDSACHWAAIDLLPHYGANPVRQRVVVDRNRISGGGVTAGIDFGLSLLAQVRGETVARVTQLVLEYDPQPPFDAGTPAKAGPEVLAVAQAGLRDLDAELLAAVKATATHAIA